MPTANPSPHLLPGLSMLKNRGRRKDLHFGKFSFIFWQKTRVYCPAHYFDTVKYDDSGQEYVQETDEDRHKQLDDNAQPVQIGQYCCRIAHHLRNNAVRMPSHCCQIEGPVKGT